MIKNRTKISRIDLAKYAEKQLFCSVKILLNMDILKKLLFLTFLSGFMASCSNEDEYADGTGFLSFGYLGVDSGNCWIFVYRCAVSRRLYGESCCFGFYRLCRCGAGKDSFRSS